MSSTPSERTFEASRQAQRVAVLTGAGISAESGVPTFRGEGGLWRQYRAEDLATPNAFARDPKLVWEWYDWRRQLIGKVQPNPGHYALAELEERCAQFTLITQNIDGLHARAGSLNILELHGNIWRMRCSREGTTTMDERAPLPEMPPRCSACGELLRPDVVWFGEALPETVIRDAYEVASQVDLFMVIGTSAVVQPAASLPLLAKQAGAYLIEVNLEETPLSQIVDQSLFGPAGEVLPQLTPDQQ